MCGILFYLTTEPFSDKDGMLRRRGPDASNTVTVGSYTFVFSRLAIIAEGATSGRVDKWTTTATAQDAAADAGVQPLQCSQYHVLANGEIYNYKELATAANIPLASLRTDIDLIPKWCSRNRHTSLTSFVNELLPQMCADIAGIVYNEATDSYVAFRDPAGVRPLCVALDKTTRAPLGFASLKTVLMADDVLIEEFPPGHYFDSAAAAEEGHFAFTPVPYHSWTDIQPCIASAALARQTIRETLFTSVRRRLLHSNVPVAFLCSGGIDSSILLMIGVTIWTAELQQPVSSLKVFTMKYDDPRCSSNDAFYASLLCSQLGVDHTIIPFTETDIRTHLDDILAVVETDDYRTIRAAVPQYFMAKYIREKTPYRVILSGEGADELFMGYNYFYLCKQPDAAAQESVRLVSNMHRYDLLRADRAMSSFGLELRVPFLDPFFVDAVFSMKGQLRNTPMEKELLRASFRQFAALAGTRILDREKEKFSDGCGLSYVPALMRIMAERCGQVLDWSTSAHTLERFEKQYVQEVFAARYAACVEQSNLDFRELPDWAVAAQRQKAKDNKAALEAGFCCV